MPDLRGLTIMVAEAALGGRARVFLQGGSVTVVRTPVVGEEDDAHARAGLPTLSQLFEEALGLGVELICCQSGLQLAGATPEAFDPRINYGGIVSLLQSLANDRLVVV